MQPRLTVGVLVLKSEGWVSVLVNSFILFQTIPCRTIRDYRLYLSYPYGCQFGRSGVVGLSAVFAVFVDPVVYLCQVFVAVRSGIDISIPAVRVSFLQEAAAFPNESVFSSRPSEN